MNGLERVELERRGFFHRLLGRKPRENAYREVQNLLAETPIKKLDTESVSGILASYGIDLVGAHERLKALYAKVLEHFAKDAELTDDEIEDLRKLRRVLALADKDVKEGESAAYRQAVKSALQDGHLTEEEKTRLQTLSDRLCLPEAMARGIYKEDAQTLLQQAYDKALQDRRLSPEEEKELEAIASNLDTNIEMHFESQAALAHFRLLWRIEQGDLPQIPVSIHLKRGEVCHVHIQASQYEMRTVTKAIRYSGPTARIRIMKGVSYRVGQINVQRISQDVVKQLDSGTLYLTNKRLLLDGQRKSTSIALSKIIDFEVFSDGVKIEKDTGKDQFFQFQGVGALEHERWGMLLKAALIADRK